eukprot:TRINITY_DN71_c1_g3_i2.p1 TRINITY_DN71_c1_g3~~TRINITY_DN71_c1_g3_i2.p1  ORF type:complete len:902 (-),score=296.85 TRINITY_DN71_c1_g3_i2:20-2638(-)
MALAQAMVAAQQAALTPPDQQTQQRSPQQYAMSLDPSFFFAGKDPSGGFSSTDFEIPPLNLQQAGAAMSQTQLPSLPPGTPASPAAPPTPAAYAAASGGFSMPAPLTPAAQQQMTQFSQQMHLLQQQQQMLLQQQQQQVSPRGTAVQPPATPQMPQTPQQQHILQGLYNAPTPGGAYATPTQQASPPDLVAQPKTDTLTIPYPTPVSTVQQILNNVVTKLQYFAVSLEQIRTNQHNSLELPPLDCAINLEALSKQHKELYDMMLQEQSILTRLFDETLLSPDEIFNTRKLQLQFQKFMKQLDLYQLELMHYVRPDTIPCPAALVITEQPFSRSIVKGQMVPIEAQLLVPSRLDIKSVGKVTADIAQYHATTKKNGKPSGPLLESAAEEVDPDGKVRMHLRLLVGTNKKPVTLRLHVSITHGPMKCHNPALAQPGTRVVESNQSRPFIITTNSIQWKDSEGILLKMEVFGDMLEVSWPRFCNTLQSYYLNATRQHAEFPARPLTLKDFEYFGALKFDRNGMIGFAAFDAFWDWFGPTLEKIRHQKHLGPMWVKGYIFGLVTKSECYQLLCHEEDGVFLIRVSDRYAGKYAVAYVTKGEVRHSLLKDSDTAGNRRTLIDTLRDTPHVQTLLQYKSDFAGKLTLAKVSKEEVLQEFFTEKHESTTPGYDDFPTFFTSSNAGTGAALPQSQPPHFHTDDDLFLGHGAPAGATSGSVRRTWLRRGDASSAAGGLGPTYGQQGQQRLSPGRSRSRSNSPPSSHSPSPTSSPETLRPPSPTSIATGAPPPGALDMYALLSQQQQPPQQPQPPPTAPPFGASLFASQGTQAQAQLLGALYARAQQQHVVQSQQQQQPQPQITITPATTIPGAIQPPSLMY